MFRGLDALPQKIETIPCDRCGTPIVLSAIIRHVREVLAVSCPTATAYNVCGCCETSPGCLPRTRWRYDA